MGLLTRVRHVCTIDKVAICPYFTNKTLLEFKTLLTK